MLSTRPLKDKTLNEDVVEKIKAFALKKNEDGMRALLRTRDCTSENLAKAIDGLLFADGSYAMNLRDTIDFLYSLLKDYPLHIDHLVQLHARCNDVYRVDELLNKYGADINSAVTGYAAAGSWMRVNALLVRGAEKVCAIYGYAAGAHVQLIERMIGDDIEKHIVALKVGFEEGGHFSTAEKFMRLLASTNHVKLRNELRFWLEEKFPDQSAVIFDKAVELNRINRQYQMKYEMALELYDEVKAIEAKHQPWFYAKLFSSDNSDTQMKIKADVLELMHKYDERHTLAALKK